MQTKVSVNTDRERPREGIKDAELPIASGEGIFTLLPCSRRSFLMGAASAGAAVTMQNLAQPLPAAQTWATPGSDHDAHFTIE